MKSLFTAFLLVLNLMVFSQNVITNKDWFSQKIGNPIDGIVQFSAVTSKENKEISLAVINRSNIKKIKNEYNQTHNGDLSVIHINLGFLDEVPEFDHIKMYFSEENTYYNVNFMTIGTNKIELISAVSKEKKILNKINFINKLKQNKTLTIRLINGEDLNDYSFSLDGSTASINNILDMSILNSTETKMDWDGFDALNFAAIIRDIPCYYDSIIDKVSDEIKETEVWDTYVDNWLTFINSAECFGGNENSDEKYLIFYDYNKIEFIRVKI